MVQQLGQPLGVPQKEPANHCLKPCGLGVVGRVSMARSTAGAIAPASHPVAFLGSQQGFEGLEGLHLGGGPHLGHHGGMETPGLAGLSAAALPLMQLPHRITEPGELERPQLGRVSLHGVVGQP